MTPSILARIAVPALVGTMICSCNATTATHSQPGPGALSRDAVYRQAKSAPSEAEAVGALEKNGFRPLSSANLRQRLAGNTLDLSDSGFTNTWYMAPDSTVHMRLQSAKALVSQHRWTVSGSNLCLQSQQAGPQCTSIFSRGGELICQHHGMAPNQAIAVCEILSGDRR